MTTPEKNIEISEERGNNIQTAQSTLLFQSTQPSIQNQSHQSEDRQYTFKIIKRRSPWSIKEDKAIIDLVSKHGTGNWTVIANEMSNIYNFKNRSGKQCRERWHNHLDPKVNKDSWKESEENILFNKHMEYGNKWSDIAKFLPGRTDNAIKNHFYSKLRKYIRKILKQINKENLIKNNGIDSNKYNSDKIYKMLKKYKIPYKSLNKDIVLDLIISTEKNSKINKNSFNLDVHIPKTKIKKIKSISKEKETSNIKEKSQINSKTTKNKDNVIVKQKNNRSMTNPKKNLTINVKMINKNKSHKSSSKNHNINLYPNVVNKPQKKKRRTKRRKVSICLSTPENKKTQISRILPQRNLFLTDLGRKRKRGRLTQEDLDPNINNTEIIRPGLEINNNKNLIIIDKNILNTTIDRIYNNNFSTTINSKFKKPTLDLNLINNSPRFLSQIPTPNYQNTNNTSLQFPNSNLDEKYYYLYYDNQLQISPMNINNMILYPPSTRNLFYLDLSSTFEPQKNKNGTYNNINTVFSQTPIGKKEINLSNKILIDSKKFINFDNNIHLFNNDDFSSEINNITLIDHNIVIDNLKNQTNSNQKKFPPQIDLNIINQSETNNLFMDSLNISNMKNNNFFNGNINNNNIFNLSPISAFTSRIQNDKT
jgi:hypothetical protein